jgi:capsid protein
MAGLYQQGRSRIALGYNATEDRGRRQAPRSIILAEDDELTPARRRKLQATAKDQPRNVAVLAWMVRRHLDYVSRFSIHVNSGYDDVDAKLERLFAWHARPDNFDISGRHDRDSFLRLVEASKVIDGDVLLAKLASGHLQGIESDLIAKPSDMAKVPKAFRDKISDHGLVLDDYLRVTHYCLCTRAKNSSARAFHSLLPREEAIFDGYFSRFSQTRGVSPFAPVVNMVADVSETLEWVALKAKLHALFGLAFKRSAPDNTRWNKSGYTKGANSTEDKATEPATVNLNPRGIFTIDCDPGDSVDPIESKTPAPELLGFTREEIRMILLALDIPFTAYDSMQASFSARIADRVEYEESVAEKRRRNAELLRQYSDWKLAVWAQVPTMLGEVMARHSLTIADLQQAIEWIPAGTPWLDKRNEAAGDQLAISLGVDSAPRVARRRGIDAYRVLDEQAAFLAYAKKVGVPIYTGAPGQVAEQAEEKPPQKEDAP